MSASTIHPGQDPLHAAGEILATSPGLLVITGAGISVESGLPSYRGPDGVYEANPTLPDLLTEEGLARDPDALWGYLNEFRKRAAEAEPCPAHRVLARWEQEARFPRFLIATQNIDGLHQAAGSDRVTELHGSLWRMARPQAEDFTDDPEFSRDAEDLLAGRDREEILRRWSLENRRTVWEDRSVPFAQIPPYRDEAIRPDILLFGEAYGDRLLWVEDFIERGPGAILVIGCSGQVGILDRLLRACRNAMPSCAIIHINAYEDAVGLPHLHLAMTASEALGALDGMRWQPS